MRCGVRWKEKVIAAAEKGIGWKKVTGRSEGWWSEYVERLIATRKVTCRRLREARKKRVGEVTLSRLWANYRMRTEVKKAIMKEEESSEEDQRAGWY